MPTGISVVIIGQDPYHSLPRQATGLAFSVPNDLMTPPSLRNIFTELKADTGDYRSNPDLSDWAGQGVLLLNTHLTVRPGEPASHCDIGWETVTDALLKVVAKLNPGAVFVLWGAHAARKLDIAESCLGGLVISSAHPSPLSAYRGFLGSKPFSKINQHLISKGKDPIKWI